MAKTSLSPISKARAAFNKAVAEVAAGKPGAKTKLRKAHEKLASLSCHVASGSGTTKRKTTKRKTTKRKTTKRKTTKRKTLRKGSPEARAYMAKIRAKRGKKTGKKKGKVSSIGARKVTMNVVNAFLSGDKMTQGNSHTDGTHLYLHGNIIAEFRDNKLYITNAGWFSNTTKERLNYLPGVSIVQKKGEWYLNGTIWDGEWKAVDYRR